MKLLVIQEQHFTRLPNGEVWVDKQSDTKFWERYLNVFDEIVVCARMKNADKLGKKALRSDRENVTFVGMPVLYTDSKSTFYCTERCGLCNF